MNNTTNSQTEERLLEQAAMYLIQMDERALSAVELIEFKNWLQKDKQNRLAFEQVASTWGKMDILQGLAEFFPLEDKAQTSTSWTPKNWASAAAVSIIALASMLIITANNWQFFIPQNPQEQVYITEIGQTKTIKMEEGSTILANTNSQLSVLITESKRIITLDKGEAFFEVAHDSERSFDVIVGDTIVRAIGTAFSVYRHGTETEVIVTEGIVEIIQNNLSSENTETSTFITPDHKLLHPGDVATYAQGNSQVISIQQDELVRKLTWRQGMLAFDGEPLEQVIEEFNRYNTITLEITDDAIRNVRVGGYFNSKDVANMLTALQDNFNVRVTYITSDHVTLSASI